VIRERADAYNDPNPSDMTELYATLLQNSVRGRDLGQVLSQIAPMQLGWGRAGLGESRRARAYGSTVTTNRITEEPR